METRSLHHSLIRNDAIDRFCVFCGTKGVRGGWTINLSVCIRSEAGESPKSTVGWEQKGGGGLLSIKESMDMRQFSLYGGVV